MAEQPQQKVGQVRVQFLGQHGHGVQVGQHGAVAVRLGIMAVGTVSEPLVPDGCVWVDIAQGSAGDGTGRDCCSLLYSTGRCCIGDGTEDGAQGGSE